MKPLCIAWLALAALLGALAACFPAAHELVGRACDEAHPCPNALLCVAGTCRASAATPEADAGDGGGWDAATPPSDAGADGGGENLLPNGGFEAGLSGWAPSSTESSLELTTGPVRSGASAAHVFTPQSTGSRVGIALDKSVLTNVPANATYCIESWVSRGTVRSNITLIARRYASSSSFEDFTGTVLTLPDDGWHRFKGKVVAVAPYTWAVNFRFSVDHVPDAGYFVDDARVWVDADGGCD